MIPDATKAAVMVDAERHIRALERRFGVRVESRDPGFRVLGGSLEGRAGAEDALRGMVRYVERAGHLDSEAVRALLGTDSPQHFASPAPRMDVPDPSETLARVLLHDARGVPVRARTKGQMTLVAAASEHPLVFAVGPAGTGKTFLAIAFAVAALERREVDRLVLVRPAVEAGESLGFLPGDLREKIAPYLQPMFDSLQVLLPRQAFRERMESGAIEMAPLAYMRGRTLDRSFVILDEAQNATIPQMKMFLTRLGRESRAVVTGDPSQVDLGHGQESGLSAAVRILQGVSGTATVWLDSSDQMRHPLVRAILDAWESDEAGLHIRRSP